VTFPLGGYVSTPTSTTNSGDWPSPDCGGYYYNGTGTVTITTGANSVLYGTNTEVQPYYCKYSYIPEKSVKTTDSSMGYQIMDSPVLGCKKLTWTDHNTNSYKCSECQIGFILDSTNATCTKVEVGSSHKTSRNKYGCAKCADASCTYCAECHESFFMECASTKETFATTECCKPCHTVSSSKKYSHDI